MAAARKAKKNPTIGCGFKNDNLILNILKYDVMKKPHKTVGYFDYCSFEVIRCQLTQ